MIIHDRFAAITTTTTTMYCFHSALYCQTKPLTSHDLQLLVVSITICICS